MELAVNTGANHSIQPRSPRQQTTTKVGVCVFGFGFGFVVFLTPKFLRREILWRYHHVVHAERRAAWSREEFEEADYGG